MKNKFIFLFLSFLIWNFASAMVQPVYTIQNPEAYATPNPNNLFWAPVTGDSVLIKVTDKSKSAVPAIIEQTDGQLVPNFEYTLPSFSQKQKPLPNGLFHFFKDKDAKLNDEYVLRLFPKSERTFIWSKVKQDYFGYSNQWHAIYNSSGKKTHPFTFKVQDAQGKLLELKIGAVAVGAAAGAAGAGAPKTVTGMIDGFEWAGESGGWILAKTKDCTDKNHIRRRGEDGIFKYVTGVAESDFESKTEADKPKIFNGPSVEDNKVICGTVGPDNLKCGTINFYKVGEFINEEKTGNFSPSGKKPSFNIIWYQLSNIKEVTKTGENFIGQRKFRNFADVGALQARSENKDAVFQLASRPNCLEGGRVYRGGDFAEIMGTMAVQGEEAASSAFPGGFARMFVDIPEIAKDDNNNGAINIFKHTNLGVYVTNGGDITGYDVSKLDSAKNWEHNLLICFLEGIAVTTGFTCVHRPGDLRRDVPFFPNQDTKIDYNSANCNEKVDNPNNQLINQVPVCALNLKNKDVGAHTQYSKQLLKAFYIGTILSAVKHKKYKIFLTMVGGSAFKNDISWIVDAIKAQEEYIKKYGLTVYVVFMDFPGNLAAANDRKPLYEMVKQIGGNTLEFTIDNGTGAEAAEWDFYEGGGKVAASHGPEKDPTKFEEIFNKILNNPMQFAAQPNPAPQPTQPQPIIQPGPVGKPQPPDLKPVDELPSGTYVIKNKIDKTFGGTGGTKNPMAWLYAPSKIDEKNEIGKNFDAVLINKNEEALDVFRFEIKVTDVTKNFNYIELDPNPVVLSRGVFVWQCDFASEINKYLYRRIGMLPLFVEDQAEGKVDVFYEYTLKDVKAVGCMQSFINTGKQYDASKYPEHPFNFKVKKIVGDKEEGPEYLVDFNKQKPEIISVIEVVEPLPAPQPQPGPQPQPAPKPQPQPQAQLQLQGKLAQLKNNLLALKNKLGSLGGKLGALKVKLGGAKTGGDGRVPKNPKFTDVKTGTEGTLQFVNLAYLIQKSVGYQTQLSKPAFNIIVFNDKQAQKFKKFADVAQVMANSLNNNAVFQFASNDDPTWTSGGGQATAILKATQEAAKRRNTARDLEPLEKASLNTKNEDPANIDNIWIGIHSNIRVAGVRDPHKINLILVAARDPNYGGDKTPHTENCQKVAYEGTLLAAANLKAPNVFLTFMGGAIFANANPRKKILEAMTNAVKSYVNKFGLNVTLIYWSDKIPTDILPLTKEIGGYVCFFENENNATYKKYPGNKNPGGSVENIASFTDDVISQKLFGPAK